MEQGDLVFGRQREGDVVRPFVGRIRSQTTAMFGRMTLFQVDSNVGRLLVPEGCLSPGDNVVILRDRPRPVAGAPSGGGDAA